MSTDDSRSFLENAEQTRGYTLEMHRIMAEVDREWATKYNEFIQATYTGQRLLDLEAALKADVAQIQAHVRVALDVGATPREILEALQAVIAPMGALAFRRGLQAWAAETGFQDPGEA